MNEHDPILDELWGNAELVDGEVEFDGPYGVGVWKDATLIDVQSITDHTYGYRVGLVLNLKGDSMKYTGRLNLPRTVEENGNPDQYERFCKREETTRNNVSGLLLGAELIPVGKKVPNVDTDADYDRVLSIFRHGIGRNVPVRVKVQQKFNKDNQKWENTDFTEIVAIKARGRK